jgi:hypothetical protein
LGFYKESMIVRYEKFWEFLYVRNQNLKGLSCVLALPARVDPSAALSLGTSPNLPVGRKETGEDVWRETPNP